MAKRFWIEHSPARVFEYGDLDQAVRTNRRSPKCVRESDVFKLWTELVCSLLREQELTLFDATWTESETARLGYSDETTAFNSEPAKSRIDLNSGWRPSMWRLNIHTSGSTGRPKKVGHTFESLTRGVRKSPKNSNDSWAFCFHPSHFAGLQVFFQALLNENPMYYLFSEDPSACWDILRKNDITRISATPTFYRQLLSSSPKTCPAVRTVTMGGECFDSNIWEKLAEFFPNARCKNIYASTEAGTLFSSLNGDVWRIPDHLRGKVKVSDESELLVHYSLIGNLHVDSNLIEGEWFRTGDLIAPVDEASFRIAGRASDQINVGGFKVDPIEVETVIRQIEFVKDCRVYARRNSVTGSLICADVLLLEPTSAAEKETAVKERMKAVLQAWKIPRIINFVAEISKTTSGKVKRT